jgi:hypothetical protein
MSINEYIGKVQTRKHYGIVAETAYNITTQSEHFFNCCLLVYEIATEIGDIAEVWDYLGKHELSDLDIFMDPKRVSETRGIGEMLYRHEPDLNCLRGKFNRTALLRLSERVTSVQTMVLETEVKGSDPLPSDLSVAKLVILCQEIEVELGIENRTKSEKKLPTPFDQLSKEIEPIFSRILNDLAISRETISNSDFSSDDAKFEAHALHEFVGAFDAEMMRIKDELRSVFKEVCPIQYGHGE